MLVNETEATAQIKKHYRWNFTVNVLDGATFWFAYLQWRLANCASLG